VAIAANPPVVVCTIASFML
jgi:hypothetical protein